MVCIYCKQPTRVTNSRLSKRDLATWRRRACLACGSVFTTVESPDLSAGFVVESSGGSLKPFSRDRLFLSIYESCKHREEAVLDASEVTRTITTKLLYHQTSPNLRRNYIVATTLEVLERFDKTAATVYKAYHLTTAS